MKIEASLHKDAGWVRMNGKLIFQYKAFWNPPLFSEREGYQRFINIGLARIRVFDLPRVRPLR